MKLQIHLPRIASPLLIATLASVALAKEPDAARLNEIAGWLPPMAISVGESITNRTAWQKLAGEPEFSGFVEKAARLARQPVPEQSDDLHLDYSRTGNRDHWQKVAFERRSRVQIFALAECLEDKGRFIAPLENLIATLCEERTWVYPAHDSGLKSFRGEADNIDLGAAMLGWELATADRLLGSTLSSKTRELIRGNLERRIFTPYRAAVRDTRPEFWWMRGKNNWNAVCLAGVTGAALAALDPPHDRAWFIAAAEDYIPNFLSGFTPDGYCSEGVGYWNYGFGHFALLAGTIRRSTDGKLDLLASPPAARPALFGARTEILAGFYPSIADCSPQSQPNDNLMRLLSRRFGFNVAPATAAGRPEASRWLYETLIYATTPTNLTKLSAARELGELPWRTWFPDGGVLICRPAPTSDIPFAACLKGGNNNEHHNHNDVGTFMVVSGGKMLICDPGAEVYTSRTFGSRRYESKVLNSFGHAVPVIAGKLQRTGPAARGVVLATNFTAGQDLLKLDIRSAYEVPELERLEREFIFQRGANPSLTITDTIVFKEPASYESALITWGEWRQVSENELLISEGKDAVRVQINSGGKPFTIRGATIEEDVRTPRKPVRIGLALQSPITQGQFKLTITPAK